MRIKGKVGVRIEVDRRFSETPQVQANDPVVAAEIRYPAIPEFRRTPIAVLQEDSAGVFPGVGVIILHIIQCGLTCTLQYRHGEFPLFDLDVRIMRDLAPLYEFTGEIARKLLAAATAGFDACVFEALA